MEVCRQTSLSSPRQSSIRRQNAPQGPSVSPATRHLSTQWANTQPTSMTAHTR